jgi:hypothetical protein
VPHLESRITQFRKRVAIVNVARIIRARSYHFVIAVWRAKAAESGIVDRTRETSSPKKRRRSMKGKS